MSELSVRWAIRLPDGNVANATGAPRMWNSREDAERALACFETYVEQLGVTGWRGDIVRTDVHAVHPQVRPDARVAKFGEKLTAWLDEQQAIGKAVRAQNDTIA
jgi:hypothetical protein